MVVKQRQELENTMKISGMDFKRVNTMIREMIFMRKSSST